MDYLPHRIISSFFINFVLATVVTRMPPPNTAVTEDRVYLLKDAESARRIPNALVPKTMHNDGNYVASLGKLCRWLGERAEIFPGFAAAEVLSTTTVRSRASPPAIWG